MVSTLAGGIVGNIPAIIDSTGSQAAFFFPERVAVDSSGNVIVVGDGGRIRQVTLAGVVTTLAGGGVDSFADGMGTHALFLKPYGVAFDARSGNIIVADTVNQRLRMLSPAHGTCVDHAAIARKLRGGFMTRIVDGFVFRCVISGDNGCWRRVRIFGWNRTQRQLQKST